MENLSNYAALTTSVGRENISLKDEANNLVSEAREKIRTLTDPLESAGMDHSIDLLKTGVKSLAEKTKLPVKKVLEVQDSYRKNGGVKGVVNYFKKEGQKKVQQVVGDAKQSVKSALGDEEDTIASLSKEDFRNAYGSIKGALKTRYNALKPETQRAFDAETRPMMQQADSGGDQFDRYQNNTSKYEQQLTKYEGLEKDEPQAQKLVSNITRTLGDTDDIAGQLKSQTQVYKKVAQENSENLESKLVGKNSIKSAIEKSGEDVVKTDAEEGGPEDILGDVVAAGVGLASFLGGVFGARRLKADPVAQVSSAYSIGA